MRKISNIFIIALLLTFLFFSHSVSAHVLQTSGSIGAVMHSNPDDELIAGEKSDFFIEFKDKENKFSLDSCDCTVSIMQAEKIVYTQPLVSDGRSSLNATFSYTMQDKGAYTLNISAKPKAGSSFQQFNLQYPLSVAQGSGKSAAIPAEKQIPATKDSMVLSVLGGVVVVSLVALIFVTLHAKRKRDR